MITADEVKAGFAKALNVALIYKYGSRQSAAAVARNFALLPDCRSPVSAETTRKWLKGIVFPDLENLVLLCNWLDLDLSSVFKTKRPASLPQEVNGVWFGRRSTDRNYQEAIDLLERLPDSRADLLIKLIRQLAEV